MGFQHLLLLIFHLNSNRFCLLISYRALVAVLSRKKLFNWLYSILTNISKISLISWWIWFVPRIMLHFVACSVFWNVFQIGCNAVSWAPGMSPVNVFGVIIIHAFICYKLFVYLQERIIWDQENALQNTQRQTKCIIRKITLPNIVIWIMNNPILYHCRTLKPVENSAENFLYWHKFTFDSICSVYFDTRIKYWFHWSTLIK